MPDEPPKRAMMQSVFSMGQYDFIRYDKILSSADELSIQASMLNSDTILPFWSVLWGMYKNFRPIIIDSKREEYDGKFRDLKQKIFNELQRMKAVKDNDEEGTIDVSIIDDLDALHMNMLEIKQLIGLGITVGRNYSTDELIAKGLRG